MTKSRGSRHGKKCYTPQSPGDAPFAAARGKRSLGEYRQILGDSKLTDEQMIELVDDLYIISRAIMELLPKCGKTLSREEALLK